MKILLLSTSFPREPDDWAGSFVLKLAAQLAVRHPLRVLTPNFPGGKSADEIQGVDIRRFVYFLPRSSQRVLYPEGIPEQLRRSVLARIQVPFFMLSFLCSTIKQSRDFDVLLCNWTIAGLVGRIAQWFTRRPYAVIVRGSDMRIIEQGGFFAHLFIHCLLKADAVCCVAEHFMPPLRALGIEHLHFAPNGLDAEEFSADRAEARRQLALDDRPVVLYVGSLIERKGVDYLVRAMEGVPARLVFVGEGHFQAKLQEMASASDLDVLFTGRVPHSEVDVWYAAADVFVLPSFHEGRPNVLMEAMESGLPCVVTDIGACKELIEDGVSGYVVPLRDSGAIHDRVKQLIADKSLRTKMGAAAQKSRKEKVPSWRQSADNYDRILESVLSASGE